MTLARPVHEGLVLGHRVRFFRSPLIRLGSPWHAHLDLLRAIGLPKDAQERSVRFLQSPAHADLVRTVATAEGLVTIAADGAARAAITSFFDITQDVVGKMFAEDDYNAGLAIAFLVTVRHLPNTIQFDFLQNRHLLDEGDAK